MKLPKALHLTRGSRPDRLVDFATAKLYQALTQRFARSSNLHLPDPSRPKDGSR